MDKSSGIYPIVQLIQDVAHPGSDKAIFGTDELSFGRPTSAAFTKWQSPAIGEALRAADAHAW